MKTSKTKKPAPKVGCSYRICKIRREADQSYRQKLLAMGIIPGAILKICRKAPLGDPYQIQVQNNALCLRHKELQLLELEALTAENSTI